MSPAIFPRIVMVVLSAVLSSLAKSVIEEAKSAGTA
jgi:hypothetical protein